MCDHTRLDLDGNRHRCDWPGVWYFTLASGGHIAACIHHRQQVGSRAQEMNSKFGVGLKDSLEEFIDPPTVAREHLGRDTGAGR